MSLHKIKMILLVSMGFVFIGGCTDDLYASIAFRYPQLQEVKKRSDEIRHDFLMARIKRYGFHGVALLGIALAAYKVVQGGHELWRNYTSTTSEVHQKNIVLPSWQEAGPEVIAKLRKLSPPFLSGDWFKNAAGYGVEGFIMLVAGKAVGHKFDAYLSQDLFHPDRGSVTWFANNKTSFFAVMEELKHHAMMLDIKAALSKHNTITSEHLMVSAINSLVVQVESIIGFIDYKKSLVRDDVCSFQIAQMSRYLFNTMDQFCHTIDVLLQEGGLGSSERKAQAISLVNELRGEATRIVVSFARIEAEAGV